MFNFSEEVMIILKKGEEEAISVSSELLSSEHILLAILNTTNSIKNILENYNLTYNKIKKKIPKNKKEKNDYLFYSASLKRILDNSVTYSKELGLDALELRILFLCMLEERESKCRKILEEMGIDIRKLYKEIKGLTSNTNSILNEIGIELTSDNMINTFDKVIGREKEIERIIEILARKKKNNPLLIGEAGVGKTAIVEELSKMIKEGKVPSFLKDYKVIMVNVSSLVAGTKYRGEFEEKLDKIIRDLESNKKIIMFIDEIHTIVGAGGAEGAIDASNILKPALARSNIKLIGATTLEEYKKFILPDKALERRFDLVVIEEPDYEKTKEILNKVKKDYEKYHNVKVPKQIIDLIVYYSDKYIKDKHEPDKSIDILDEVCACTSIKMNDESYENKISKITKLKNKAITTKEYDKAIKFLKKEKELKCNKLKKDKIVTKEILKMVLENKINTRIFELENKNISKYLFDKLIKESNISQKSIKEITSVYESHTNKKRTNSKPTSIILEGKSGIGKTDIAKLISKYTKNNLITISLKEFRNEMSISRFIGASSGYIGYNDNNTVFESLKFYPNSIILFDNIDEAHISIINLIKSILENGKITNSKGNVLNFSNSFIILTRNVNIEKKIGFSNSQNNVNKTMYCSDIDEFVNKIVKIENIKKEKEPSLI